MYTFFVLPLRAGPISALTGITLEPFLDLYSINLIGYARDKLRLSLILP
jgi:hypothetical protein